MRRSWPLLLLLVFGAVAFAEVTLTGRVLNENNAPVKGVRVTLRSQAGDVYYFVITDPTGAFAFKAPQAGEYLVSADHENYFKLKDRPVKLAEGSNEAVLTLVPLREVFERLEVNEQSNAVELDRTTTQETVTANQILEVPYPSTSNLRNAVRLFPAVVQDNRGEIHVQGGSEEQVLYTLDGFNLGDPITGRFESRMSVEAVQSMELTGTRTSAEFGKGSAGVLALRTRAGDDRIRYSATNFFPGFETSKGLMIGGWAPRANVSGPWRKGRAWFSNSFETVYDLHLIPELPKGEDRTSSWRFSNLLHNQINLTPGNILHSGFLAGWWFAPRTGLSVLDPLETTVDRRSRQWFLYLKDQIYLSRGALIEIGFAGNRTFGREIPQGQEFYQLTPDGKRGNNFLDATRKAGRDQWLANVFLPTFTWHGGHQIKTGLDINRVRYWQNAHRTGFWNYRLDDQPLRLVQFEGNGELALVNVETAAYVQDSWRIRPGLQLELGLRADWDRMVRRWAPSPRAGFAWSPGSWSFFRPDATKFSGGFGVVYDASNLRLFSRPRDQFPLTTYFDPNGEILAPPALARFEIEPGRLRAPRHRNWNLGWEQQWPRSLSSRVEYKRRRGINGLSYFNPIPPGPGIEALYLLDSDRRDVYDAVEFTARQTFKGSYEWMASYTRSRARSNAVMDLSADEPLIVESNAGPLGWDVPHRFLSWAYLPTPFRDWALAWLIDWRSGFPWSRQSEDGRILSPINSERFPQFFEFNLHVEKRVSFLGHRWALRAGFNNITNHRNHTTVNPNLAAPDFGQFYGGFGRTFNVRMRWLGKI